ncbi:MAG: beta/gamma crystallin-related protein [Acidobacteriota bacterium]|nr:beta/gamma crystallin-related protein [Acidobacteriota bacterium]
MKQLKVVIFAAFCFFLFSENITAQYGQVVIYNDFNFQGANIPLNGNWNGDRGFDRNIKSIRVPQGYKVTIYREKNFKGTESPLTEDWTSFIGSPWIGNIRSIRVERVAVQPPTSGNFPVIYAQPNFQGPAEAIENGYAGRRDWEGSPHRIRSIRVPAGWKLTLYTERNYRGTETMITSDISWEPGAFWNGRARSIRVTRDSGTVPGGFAVVYAQNNYNGPAMVVERDWPGHRDWDGRPHRIRSIRVPQGRPIMVYERANYRGKSYLVTSDWAPQPGDWWYGKIRSIKVNPGPQPR